MYTEKSCNFLSSPSLTLINSTKSISLVSVRDFFDKVAVIFNLSAPGAAKLENPFALSNNEESSLDDIIDSVTFNPTRYDGLFEYGSNTMVLAGTLTKVPLMKYTPSFIFTALPTAEAFVDTNVATLSPVEIVVFP